jgi:hypothetical protein
MCGRTRALRQLHACESGSDTLTGRVALIAALDPGADAGAARSPTVGTLRGGDHLFADGFD